MTARVYDLTSRLPRPDACGCAACTLRGLRDRAADVLARHDGQLLVPVADVAAIVDDIASTIAAVIDVALREERETNP